MNKKNSRDVLMPGGSLFLRHGDFGAWTVRFDWTGCMPCTQVIVFNDCGTLYTTDPERRGRWRMVGKTIIWTFTDCETVYTGEFTGRSMAGVMTDFKSIDGIWDASYGGYTICDDRDITGRRFESGNEAASE